MKKEEILDLVEDDPQIKRLLESIYNSLEYIRVDHKNTNILPYTYLVTCPVLDVFAIKDLDVEDLAKFDSQTIIKIANYLTQVSRGRYVFDGYTLTAIMAEPGQRETMTTYKISGSKKCYPDIPQTTNQEVAKMLDIRKPIPEIHAIDYDEENSVLNNIIIRDDQVIIGPERISRETNSYVSFPIPEGDIKVEEGIECSVTVFDKVTLLNRARILFGYLHEHDKLRESDEYTLNAEDQPIAYHIKEIFEEGKEEQSESFTINKEDVEIQI